MQDPQMKPMDVGCTACAACVGCGFCGGGALLLGIAGLSAINYLW